MSRTANFCRTLCDELGQNWKRGNCPDSKTRECVDVMSAEGGTTVLVEVELRRDAPAANVAKIWRWLAETDYYPGRVIVVQAFSSYYQTKHGSWQRASAEFIGQQMEHNLARVRYIRLPFKYAPRKRRKNRSVTEGGGAMRRAARKLAAKIRRRLKDRPRALAARA